MRTCERCGSQKTLYHRIDGIRWRCLFCEARKQQVAKLFYNYMYRALYTAGPSVTMCIPRCPHVRSPLRRIIQTQPKYERYRKTAKYQIKNRVAQQKWRAHYPDKAKAKERAHEARRRALKKASRLILLMV